MPRLCLAHPHSARRRAAVPLRSNFWCRSEHPAESPATWQLYPSSPREDFVTGRDAAPWGRANPARDRTPSSVGYAHDAVRAFETSSGVAAPAPAAGRRSDSCRRVLDAVPARPQTGRAPNPRNTAESAPRSYPAATPRLRRSRLVDNPQRGSRRECRRLNDE